MRSTLLLLAASTISVARAGVASQSSEATATWAWPSAETRYTSTATPSASVVPTSMVSKDAPEASLSMAVESAYSASLAATMAYTSTRNASTATSTLSPSATPTESFTRAAPMQQCLGRLDGELPAYTPPGYTFSGKIRRYYISAEPITWNYMPTGWDNWLGVPLEDSPRVYRAGYTEAAGSLGLLWEKAVYRGYTDATFSNYTETADWMGINGPIVRAEVGDMIEILFVNNLASHFASIHSMGLSYNKDNEGSLYPNNTTPGMTSGSQNADIYSTPNTTQSVGNAVPPGGCFTYKWVVSNSSAPTGSALTKFWAYHPYVNMQSDMDAGLVGPCIIYAPGTMESVVASTREFILLYMNFNEQNSWMAETNANAYGLTNLDTPSGPMPALGRGYGNASVWQPQIINMPSVSLSSTQAPSFHSLNGYSYSNCPRFEMCVDDPVIWYVYAFGMASHVFHLHGNNYYFNGEEHASISFNDGVMRALPMNASSPGEWNLICHVSNHQVDGMVDNYVVRPNQGPNGTCGLPPLATMLPFRQ